MSSLTAAFSEETSASFITNNNNPYTLVISFPVSFALVIISADYISSSKFLLTGPRISFYFYLSLWHSIPSDYINDESSEGRKNKKTKRVRRENRS